MAPRGNKYVKRAIITDKKRRSWNALKKLAVILYQEKVCSVRSAATKFNFENKHPPLFLLYEMLIFGGWNCLMEIIIYLLTIFFFVLGNKVNNIFCKP